MKRDLEVIRKLLLRIESYEDVELPDIDQRVRSFHLLMLQERNFTKGIAVVEIKNGDPQVQQTMEYVRLTSDGYNFLDSIRDDGIWKKTKERVAEVGGGVTFDVLASIATYFVMQKLGVNK
ncbi:DUF2513 domain-containing protein [Planctomicrobium piriforme]|uniref:YjcQ protein n=1 Tax=Planctomicrobium piriforme TaxID=1576369 RepID=A0A1I3L3C1_9PLAN|nr:DUF2513 domain-containing protein [Planctomicrobium piriforme]SFI79201.1 YjcQ protein [Planctomicrobium piriforme]